MIFKIKENSPVADRTFRLLLSCEGGVPVHEPGQFVDIAIPGFYLRRPISVCDSTENGLVLYYKTVGEGTAVLSGLAPGTELDLLTGLGKAFDTGLCNNAALLLGGGLGAAPMFSLCKKLLSEGKKPTVVLGFNTAADIVLEEEFRSLGVVLHIATLDGTTGTKGTVLDAIGDSGEAEVFYTCGPLPMMRAICGKLDIPGQLSLEERMGCGAGFCYGCSRLMTDGAKRICKDGPVFNKEEVIWQI